MQKDNLFYIFLFAFIVLVLLQVLVFNRISILGFATPYIYIYMIIKLPVKTNRNLTLLIGFLLGFMIDIFCNTPGINAAATTFAAFIRRPLQTSFTSVDDYAALQMPNMINYGTVPYIRYVILMILIHHVTLVMLESFSYFNLALVLKRIILSSILTSIIILGLEGFSSKKKKERGTAE